MDWGQPTSNAAEAEDRPPINESSGPDSMFGHFSRRRKYADDESEDDSPTLSDLLRKKRRIENAAPIHVQEDAPSAPPVPSQATTSKSLFSAPRQDIQLDLGIGNVNSRPTQTATQAHVVPSQNMAVRKHSSVKPNGTSNSSRQQDSRQEMTQGPRVPSVPAARQASSTVSQHKENHIPEYRRLDPPRTPPRRSLLSNSSMSIDLTSPDPSPERLPRPQIIPNRTEQQPILKSSTPVSTEVDKQETIMAHITTPPATHKRKSSQTTKRKAPPEDPNTARQRFAAELIIGKEMKAMDAALDESLFGGVVEDDVAKLQRIADGNAAAAEKREAKKKERLQREEERKLAALEKQKVAAEEAEAKKIEREVEEAAKKAKREELRREQQAVEAKEQAEKRRLAAARLANARQEAERIALEKSKEKTHRVQIESDELARIKEQQENSKRLASALRATKAATTPGEGLRDSKSVFGPRSDDEDDSLFLPEVTEDERQRSAPDTAVVHKVGDSDGRIDDQDSVMQDSQEKPKTSSASFSKAKPRARAKKVLTEEGKAKTRQKVYEKKREKKRQELIAEAEKYGVKIKDFVLMNKLEDWSAKYKKASLINLNKQRRKEGKAPQTTPVIASSSQPWKRSVQQVDPSEEELLQQLDEELAEADGEDEAEEEISEDEVSLPSRSNSQTPARQSSSSSSTPWASACNSSRAKNSVPSPRVPDVLTPKESLHHQKAAAPASFESLTTPSATSSNEYNRSFGAQSVDSDSESEEDPWVEDPPPVKEQRSTNLPPPSPNHKATQAQTITPLSPTIPTPRHTPTPPMRTIPLVSTLETPTIPAKVAHKPAKDSATVSPRTIPNQDHAGIQTQAKRTQVSSASPINTSSSISTTTARVSPAVRQAKSTEGAPQIVDSSDSPSLKTSGIVPAVNQVQAKNTHDPPPTNINKLNSISSNPARAAPAVRQEQARTIPPHSIRKTPKQGVQRKDSYVRFDIPAERKDKLSVSSTKSLNADSSSLPRPRDLPVQTPIFQRKEKGEVTTSDDDTSDDEEVEERQDHVKKALNTPISSPVNLAPESFSQSTCEPEPASVSPTNSFQPSTATSSPSTEQMYVYQVLEFITFDGYDPKDHAKLQEHKRQVGQYGSVKIANDNSHKRSAEARDKRTPRSVNEDFDDNDLFSVLIVWNASRKHQQRIWVERVAVADPLSASLLDLLEVRVSFCYEVQRCTTTNGDEMEVKVGTYANLILATHKACKDLIDFVRPKTPNMNNIQEWSDLKEQIEDAKVTSLKSGNLFSAELEREGEDGCSWLDCDKVSYAIVKVEVEGLSS